MSYTLSDALADARSWIEPRSWSDTEGGWAPALALLVQEIDRLRAVENAALRVASSRRDGIVTDHGALDRLDAALEGEPVVSASPRA